MSSQASSADTQAQAATTDYDPARDTVAFDVLAILTTVAKTCVLCSACRQTVLTTARRACDLLILPQSAASSDDGEDDDDEHARLQSQIRKVWSDDPRNELYFASTLNPSRTSVSIMLAVRKFTNPARHKAMVERVLDALWRDGDDTWNLAQAQLWYVLSGSVYTVVGAVHGKRPVAEYAEGFLMLMNRVWRGKLRKLEEMGVDSSSLEDHDVLPRDENNMDWKLMCPKGECFTEPWLHSRYPWSGKPGLQRTWALEVALQHMDEQVKELVVDQLQPKHKPEWPAEVRGAEEPIDHLTVLAAVEKQVPAFRAWVEALGRGDEYREVQRAVEDQIREWREGAGVRATLLAALSEIDSSLAEDILEDWSVDDRGRLFAIDLLSLRQWWL